MTYRCSACQTTGEGIKPSPLDPDFGEGKCLRCGKKRIFVLDSVKKGGMNRDEGMKKAMDHSKTWSEQALDWIWNLPIGYEFKSEEMTGVLGMPQSSNAVGAVVGDAAKRGWIKKGQPVKAERPNQNSTTIFMWKRVRPPRGRV